jgi:extracellular elastinolytic metalloproteinase
MRSFLLTSLVSLAIPEITQGHPYHGTHSLTRRAVNLDSFRMKIPVTYKNAKEVGSDPTINSLIRRASIEDTATDLVKATVPGASFRLIQSYVGTNGIAHFYFKQTAHGIDIDNGDFNVNVSVASVYLFIAMNSIT